MAEMTLKQVRSNMRDAMNSVLKDDTRRMVVDWYNAINAAIKQREQDAKDAERYRWLAQYPNLFTVNDLLRADQYTTLTRACDALMSVAAMAKESGNGR